MSFQLYDLLILNGVQQDLAAHIKKICERTGATQDARKRLVQFAAKQMIDRDEGLALIDQAPLIFKDHQLFLSMLQNGPVTFDSFVRLLRSDER